MGIFNRHRWVSCAALLVGFFVCRTAMAVGAERDYGAKSLDALIQELALYNPDYLGLGAEVRAASERIPQAASLEDPTLSIDAMDIATRNPDLDRTPMDGVQFEVMQEIPFPGKLSLKKKIATSEQREILAMRDEVLNELIATFKAAYYDYAYAEKAMAIYERNRRRLESITAIVSRQYSAGAATQADLLNAGAEVTLIERERLEIQSMQGKALARLNAALARPFGTPFYVQAEADTLDPLLLTLSELHALAKDKHPTLRQAAHALDAASDGERLAKREWLPDLGLRVGYRVRAFDSMAATESENFLSTGVQVSLPIWGARKQKKMVEEARSMREAKGYAQAAAAYEIESELGERYAMLGQIREQYALTTTRLIPELSAALRSAERSYEANAMDYRDLIETELKLFAQELSALTLHYEYKKAVAMLEMAVGQSLMTNTKEKQP